MKKISKRSYGFSRIGQKAISLDIDNIITYLEPLYFDFVIEFVPKGKEEITQFISWAGGCGCSMWPDYFVRTMSELKLIR